MTRKPQGAKAVVHICGPGPCPNDEDFHHESYYGCVPKNFSLNTGRSRTHKQRKFVHPSFPFGYKYLWDGGCDEKLRAELESTAETPG